MDEKETKPETEKVKEEKVEEKKEKPKLRFKLPRLSSEWYDRHYKKLLFISLSILFVSFIYVAIFYSIHGDFMFKDVSLTGGTVLTVYTDKAVDLVQLEAELENKLDATVSTRVLEEIATGKQLAIVVETQAEAEKAKEALEAFLGFKLSPENSSVEISSPALSAAFYRQLLMAVAIAFVFMAITVFIIFRSAIPSLAVIVAALTDIVATLAIANLLGFRISTAGIAAFLMLIGYSIDTDIMLNVKVLKRKGEATLNTRLWRAAKTGLMMTGTSLAAVLIGYFIAQSEVIRQIFFILSVGLAIDLVATWFGNAAILKWYCTRKKIS